MKVSSNPAYSGEPLNLTCRYDRGYIVQNIVIRAFNDTHERGLIWHDTARGITTSTGVFSGEHFSNFSELSAENTVTLTASQSLQLFMNCTVELLDESKVTTLTSATVFVVVNGKCHLVSS